MEQARLKSLEVARKFIRDMNEGGPLAQRVMVDHDLRLKTINRLFDLSSLVCNEERELSDDIRKLANNLKVIEAVGKLMVNDV